MKRIVFCLRWLLVWICEFDLKEMHRREADEIQVHENEYELWCQ
jgi:hypothetical protein